MAGKTSTLVWDTPPDGGSDITEYRVLLFEDSTLVATLTSEDPMVDVEHSETVDRLALIQASNEQGYSAPLQFVIPPEPAGVSVTLSGGGNLAATGVNAGSPPAYVVPTITVTDITDTGFTVNRTDPGSGYDSYELVVLVSGAGDEGSQHIPNATFPYLVTGLTPGTEYLTGIVITLANGDQDQSNLISPTTTGTPPGGTVAQGGNFEAGLIETAPQFTEDGVATWSTANKTASANEVALTTALNRSRVPMWFKFYLSDPLRIRFSGLPSNANMGFSGMDGSTTDSYAYLFGANSGTVTDADLPNQALSLIASDDDSGGSGQPYIDKALGSGWYYILICAYAERGVMSDGRLAFRILPQ